MANANRIYHGKPLIHHSDRGVQYCSDAYQDLLSEYNIKTSMTESYDPYANAAESWLVSPAIDLSGVSSVTLSFEHAANFAAPQGYFFVMISKDYNGDVTTATWSELPISAWPDTNSNWTFVTGTADLSAFVGQSVTIAFKYTSSVDHCGAWEVKHFVVEGE